MRSAPAESKARRSWCPDHFAGRSRSSLFMSVTKTAITLKGTRRGFAGLKPRAASLDGYLDLQRRVEDTRIRRAGPYTKRLFVHQFRVVAPEELDATFAGWIAEAYAVGAGAHLD